MPPALATALTLFSGLCWTLVYIDIIHRGFRDKTYGMPLFALAFNISWEFIFGFLLYQGFALQRIVNIVWFSLDVIITYTYFRHGRAEFLNAYARYFVAWSLAAFAIGFITIYFAGTEFADRRGATYTAFAQNLMMSILFIGMLIRRDNVQGQSMYIAIFKWLGTLAPTILAWFATGSKLVLVLGIAIFLYDVLYIVLLYRKFLELRLNPLTRRPQ